MDYNKVPLRLIFHLENITDQSVFSSLPNLLHTDLKGASALYQMRKMGRHVDNLFLDLDGTTKNCSVGPKCAIPQLCLHFGRNNHEKKPKFSGSVD